MPIQLNVAETFMDTDINNRIMISLIQACRYITEANKK